MISLTSTSGADAARRASLAVREGAHLIVDSESCCA
jgi:hypothetical protein